MGALWFVTGGARSGKSRFAERLAAETGRSVVYLATMEPLDSELEARVARHRASRPAEWHTVEVPLDIVSALASVPSASTVLLDCLSLWVSNRIMRSETSGLRELDALERETDSVLDEALAVSAAREAPTIMVSNEVGAGVVPAYPLGRAYRDLLGHANQRVGGAADRAWLLVAGRALLLPDIDSAGMAEGPG